MMGLSRLRPAAWLVQNFDPWKLVLLLLMEDSARVMFAQREGCSYKDTRYTG